jgi:hypothetical protein
MNISFKIKIYLIFKYKKNKKKINEFQNWSFMKHILCQPKIKFIFMFIDNVIIIL